jgi:hypothetical protein
MRTTLDISDSLFRKLKAKAALQGITMKEFLTRLIESEVEKPDQMKSRKPSPLPVAIRLGEGPAIPYRTNTELQAILDEEDIQDFRKAHETD